MNRFVLGQRKEVARIRQLQIAIAAREAAVAIHALEAVRETRRALELDLDRGLDDLVRLARQSIVAPELVALFQGDVRRASASIAAQHGQERDAQAEADRRLGQHGRALARADLAAETLRRTQRCILRKAEESRAAAIDEQTCLRWFDR
jgi:hypothetical protein